MCYCEHTMRKKHFSPTSHIFSVAGWNVRLSPTALWLSGPENANAPDLRLSLKTKKLVC